MSIRSAIIDFFKSGNGSLPIVAQSPIVYSDDLDFTGLDGRALITKDMMINDAPDSGGRFIELDFNTDVSFDSTIWGNSGLTPFQLYNKNPDFPNIDPTFGYWIGTTIVDRAFNVGRMEITFWDIELNKVTHKYERAKDDTKTAWGAWTRVLTESYSPDLSNYAPLGSPVFSGNPTAPTPSVIDNDTSIATTAFVKSVVADNAKIVSPPSDPESPGDAGQIAFDANYFYYYYDPQLQWKRTPVDNTW